MRLLDQFLKDGEREYTHKRLGLERMRIVLERLGHPEKTYPSVLIAGTNGKGSVSRMVESVMLAAGYPVGLFTSPHLERFTERIRVGGEEVPEEFLEKILKDLAERNILAPDGSIDPEKDLLSWFEKGTVLAFEVFRRKEVPLAILEVGMGARLDATNVVDPLVSAITSVSFDHTEVLGNSLFEIAQEKIAVMRPGRPLVLGPMEENVRTFLSKAARMGQAKPVIPRMPEGTWRQFSYGPFENLSLSLAGRHQVGNAATAIEMLVALKETGFKIENSHIHRGLAEARIPGRLEIFSGKPTVLLDGAHNEASMQALVNFLREEFSDKSVTVLLGMMKDKDVPRVLEILQALRPRWVFTQIPSPRAVTMKEWERWIRLPGKELEGKLIKDPQEAFVSAKRDCRSEGLLVVAGSFYLAGIIRPHLFEHPTTP
jgi:dihydrofolate synthase/folylpolyglutamate synthase